MELNPVFLKTFRILLHVQSFTKTAEVLHMTQPGVSQHIRTLEDQLGIELIHRYGKKFEISEAGEKLYHFTASLEETYQQLLSNLQSEDEKSGSLIMGSPGSFGITFYDFLLDLKDLYPGLDPHFYYTPNTTIEREVLEGKMDMGFMTIKPSHQALSFKKVGEERLCLMVPRGFRIKNFQSLEELGYIGHPDGEAMGELLLAANWPKEFRGMDQLKLSGKHNQIHRILEPVARGHGFTVLPEYACKSFPDQSRITRVKLKHCFKNDVFAVYKKYRPLPSRYQLVLDEWERYK